MSKILTDLIACNVPPDTIAAVAQLIADARNLEQRRTADRKRKQLSRAGHVTSRDVTGQTGTQNAQESTSLTSSESVSRKKESSLRSESIKSDFPTDFREKFWALYPRRVGKKAAIRRLEMVRKSGEIAWTEFVAAIGKIDKRDPKFIPHPATWLNQGRYLDHRPVVVTSQNINGIGWRPGLPTAEEILNGKAPGEDGDQGSDPAHSRPRTAPVSQSGAGFHCLAPK